MTIITKPITEQKHHENHVESSLVINETAERDCNEHTVIDPNADDVEAWMSPTTRRRVSTATTICVFITALLVMSIGIIGGVYLYRQFSQHQMNRFRGWCGIPYDRDLMGTKRHLPFGGHPVVYKGNDAVEWTTGALFKEEFDLDLEDDSYEEIRVPIFEYGRKGHFVHDFRVNKTGIIDVTYGRCFVMPLDRDHIVPPRTMFDVIKRMWMGYYEVDTRVVRRTMRVTYPPVRDYKPLGVYIERHCSHLPTYILERKTEEVNKRSVDAQLGEDDEDLEFVEFAGNKIVQYSIVDSAETQQQQQQHQQ